MLFLVIIYLFPFPQLESFHSFLPVLENDSNQMESILLPRRSSVPLGFVSPNIQANATAIVPMRTAKTASNFLTP